MLEYHSLIEFSLNYTKLSMLARKAYVGESKINPAKKVTSAPGGIQPGTTCDPL